MSAKELAARAAAGASYQYAPKKTVAPPTDIRKDVYYGSRYAAAQQKYPTDVYYSASHPNRPTGPVRAPVRTPIQESWAPAPGVRAPAAAPSAPAAAPAWPTVGSGAQNFFKNMPGYSYFKPMDPNEKRRLAAEYAGLQIDPHIQGLTRALEQAIAGFGAQESRIHGAFAGTEAAFGRREAAQAQKDLESAIARTGGRSGVVDWLSAQRGEHFTELLGAEEAKKSAELTAIANQLGLLQRQTPQQIAELEARRGEVTSQELQRLQDQDYQRGREYDLDQWARSLGIFDRTMLTPAQQLQLYVSMAEAAGQFPSRTPDIYGR